MFFEDKVLYTERIYRHGAVDDLFGYDLVGADGSTAMVRLDGQINCDCVLIVPGGLTGRALAAIRQLLIEDEIVCQLVVPSRLHPFDLEPLLPVVRQARLVCVAEDGSAGGTWGAGIAEEIHTRLWTELRHPVRLVHAKDSIVPTAVHLEREVLVQAITIHRAVREVLSGV